MVKNLPTVERSTKIRFGKHVPDSDVQAENTIVFNASNTVLNTPNSGSIYMSPVRFRDDFSDTNIVLMMYNRQTGELSESGESASNLVGGQTLQATTDRGNTTTLTTRFTNPDTSFVTGGKVGIANSLPGHTLSVGSNVYIDDTGSNVLVVSGGILLDGNLTVNGDVTSITTENLRLKDAIIELGQNNTSGDTTLDLGLIMTRPQSNVTVGFLESSKEIVLGFTESSADSNVITPLTSEDINVHVYGRLYTEANVGVLNTNPMHTLDVGSNLYVDEFGSNILVVNGNTYLSDIVSVGDKLGVKTTDPDAELHVMGNAYVSSNLTVDTDTLHVDSTTNSVGIETKNPQANLHVVGNTYISSDLTIDTDTFHVDTANDHVGINTKVPDAELHVVGNTYISDDLTIATDTFHAEASTQRVGIKTKTPDAELHVVGNAYVSSNLTVDTDTLHVDAVGNKVGIKTKNPDAELHVVGNAYVSSNLTVDTETLHVDAEASHVGVNTKTPKANLHVVGNVYVSSNLTVDTDTLHVDTVNKRVGIETKNPTSNLHVVGNVYVSSNVTTDGTLNLKHPTTALITDLTSNVEVKLDQLNSVVIGGEKALANEDMLVYDGSNWTNQLQNHTFLYAKAEETIAKGDAVYATGAIGNNMFSIAKAQANSSATMPALGLAYQAFDLNQEGLIVTFGRADGVDTDNFQTGETVYVSNVTAGALSNVKPYGPNDLIQNVGLVVKGNSNGIVNVTGVGRSNDIPNAPIVADEGDINYVYVNDANNDLKKILPTNLLTQLQTLQQVTDTGNTTSNTIQFTNTTTGLVTTSNIEVGSNISVAGLVDATHKHVPMVGLDGFLEKSPIYFTTGGKYVVTAAEAEFLGNLTLSGNTVILSSNNVTIEDRIFGVAANNSASGLDSGFMIEHQDDGTYANIAMIYHADEHRLSFGYTQSTFTDDHILHYDDPLGLIIDLRGNVQVQNSTTLSSTLDVTGATTVGGDLTVGAVSNLFVDVSSSRVGINEASPTVSLDVNGDARVQDTTDAASVTTGALVVSGGLGVASNIHSTNVYAASHVGVGTDTATAPLHLLVSGTGETTNGIYVKNATGSGLNDSIVNLEVAASGGDPFITWNQASGSAFAMGLDSSENLLAIANSKSDLTTNQLLHMTTTGITTIENTTNSTSKTTGALIVGGGLGVAGDVYATNVIASSNLTVGTNILHVDTVSPTSNVGIGTTNPQYSLDVVGDINFSNAFFQGGSLFVSTPWTIEESPDALSYVDGNVGIGGVNPSASLHVTGNTYISSNLEVGTGNLFVDTTTSNVGIGSTTPEYSLDVVGDINFSGDLYQGKSLFVSTPWTIEESPDALSYTSGNVGIGVVNPSANLHVVGNVYVSSNLEVDGNLILNTVTTNAIQGLEGIVNTSNITSNTIQFTNSDTAFTTNGNAYVGGLVTQSTVPAFTVKRSGTTSVIGASNLEYNTVVRDNTSSYSSSNGRFTAPITGHYFFSAHGVWQGAETVYDFTINGTRQNINALCDSTSSSNDLQISISAVLYVTAGQYVNVYQDSGGTYGTDNNSFCGYLIG
jgi:hypothetical protein